MKDFTVKLISLCKVLYKKWVKGECRKLCIFCAFKPLCIKDEEWWDK